MKRNILMQTLALLLVFAMTGCGVAKRGASQEYNSQAESVNSSESAGFVSSNVEPEEATSLIEEPENDVTTSGESEDSNAIDTNTETSLTLAFQNIVLGLETYTQVSFPDDINGTVQHKALEDCSKRRRN